MENTTFHKLCSLEIDGGFLDGEEFYFTNGLNCLIGARGTGKTTVLEFIRYAMNEDSHEQSAQKRIASIIKQNLGGGHVRLKVETKNGLQYTISRADDEEPIVLDSNNNPTAISMKNGGLFRINVFSQNEIEAIADQESSQLGLIDHFKASELSIIQQDITYLKHDLQKNAGLIIPLHEKINTLDSDLKQLPGIKEKLKAFGSEGGADSEIINAAHEAKALRDRESKAITGAWKFLVELEQQVQSFTENIDSRESLFFSGDILSGKNSDRIKSIREDFEKSLNDIENMLGNIRERITTEKDNLKNQGFGLKEEHEKQELEFQELMAKHKEAQSKATERAKLEKFQNDLVVKAKEKDELSRQLGKLLEDRNKMLQKLSELRDERYNIRKGVADEINSHLHPNIKVTILQDMGADEYRNTLEAFLRGCGMQQAVVAKKITEAFPPSELVSILRLNDQHKLIDTGSLNESQAAKVTGKLSEPDILFKLELVELEDVPKIELNDNGNYKKTNELSTGQKCTAILPILLLDSDTPLLIDQPEDNLDNRFVFETIVEKIRNIKLNRQLFFVTHNPNIPVLGDAEKVFVLESNGKNAKKIREGNVDECRENIITLLEGGKEAFAERHRRYSVNEQV